MRESSSAPVFFSGIRGETGLLKRNGNYAQRTILDQMYLSRQKQRDAWKRWYRKNKKEVRQRVDTRNREITEWLTQLKKSLKCIRCGENHIACLHFHHRDPKNKTGSIGEFLILGWSIERIKKEIEKCDVLCANCHAKLHYDERNNGV